MKLEDIKTIGVVGAGTMGAGIAQMAALAGYEVVLYDIEKGALDKALQVISRNMDGAIQRNKITEAQKTEALSRLRVTEDLSEVIAEVIIEAVAEKLEVKQQLFEKLAMQNQPDTILATNTSSIPITRIAARLDHPERVVGMHFFNPAHIMKLVEVISGAATDAAVTATIGQLAEKMGKQPVVAQDSPGFIVNRVARHFYLESLKLLEENVADHATIDTLVEATGFKMGPFRLMDLIGVDVNYAVTTSMYESFHYHPKFRPKRMQQQKVDAGHLGRKTGRGFYEYGDS